MRRYGTILTLALVSLFLSTQLFAGGIDLTGVGARAQAMGGNYRAISDDWSALHWNTAGMAFTEGWSAGFSNEFITVGVGYTPAKYEGQDFSVLNQGETENEPKTYLVPSGGAYYSTGKWAFGLGVWAPFGLGAKWDLMNTANYNPNYPEFDYDDDLKVINIQPTVAYKISDKLSIGLGLGLVSANITIQKPNFTRNPLFFDDNYEPLKPLLETAGVMKPEYNHILTDTKLEGDGMGFSANLGVMYKATESLTFGATFQYYSTVKLDGTVNATTYMPADTTAIRPTLDYALANNAITQEIYGTLLPTLLQTYSGAVVPRPETDVEADLSLPMRIGFGVAWTGIENLVLSADVAYTQWSCWDVIEINNKNTGENVSNLKEKWEDGVRFGVGAEYDLGMLVARGSWYTEPAAAVEATMTPSIPDFGIRQVVIAGIGVPVGPVVLHASFEKIMVGDSVIEEWNYDQAEQVYDNLAGSYNMNINIIMLGIDYNF